MELIDQDCDSNDAISEIYVRKLVPEVRNQSYLRLSCIPSLRTTLPFCLLRVTHSLKLYWDVFVMILAAWNSFYVPFVVAFMSVQDNIALILISATVDLVYIVDIAVYMRTTYIDLVTGEEVTDSLKIIKNYWKSGRLAVDVISAIPFDVIYLLYPQYEGLQLIALTKITRLLRFSKIFLFLRAKSHAKLTLKLLHLLFIFVVYLHLTACMWFMFVDVSHDYIPPALAVDKSTSLYDTGQIFRQYAFSLYMTFTAAEIGPKLGSERIFAGFSIILSKLFQAYMFGEITVVFFALNKEVAFMTNVLDAATTAMTNIGLDSGLQAKIVTFLRYSQGRARNQAEFEDFFRMLPPSMKQEVRALTFEHIITLNSSLKTLSQAQIHLLHRLQAFYSQPEEKIITQGDEANSLYFIATGKCKVFVLDADKNPCEMKSLGIGKLFGEIAMVFPVLRTASVVSAGHATLAVLNKEDFAHLSYKYPQLRNLLKASAMRYHDKWKIFVKTTIRRCPFFANLSENVLSQIIYRLPTSRLLSSTLVYKEGDISDKILFIIDGNVRVSIFMNDERLMMYSRENINKGYQRTTNNRRSSIAVNLKKRKRMNFMVNIAMEELGIGSVLCPNLALLKEGKVNFHAKTTETTIVMTLSKDLLKRLCKEYPEINKSVRLHKDQLTNNASFTRVQRLQLTGLDYICAFPASCPPERVNLWQAKMKVRRCAIGKLLEKRQIRATGFQDIFSLSHKLKGLILAESQGDLEMAEKIRRGFLPASADSIFPALQLLHLVEVENPILTQFAVEAVKIGEALTDARDGLLKAYVSARKLRRVRESARREIREVQKLTEYVQKLLPSDEQKA